MSAHIDMTASEMGYLWTTYQTLSLNRCILKYFAETVSDEEVSNLNSSNLEACERYLKDITTILNQEEFPIPVGFSELEDVNLGAEKLYTDSFILFFQWFVAKGNLNYGAISFNTIARNDVASFYKKFIHESLDILDETRKVLLSKGLWVRSPYIPVPSEVTFVQKQSFLNGWFGDKRPLAGQEVAAIFYNHVTNQIGYELMKSFIQLQPEGELKNYLVRGKDLASKQIEAMSDILKSDELPAPSTWNSGVTTSVEAPFSNKLILNLVNFLNAQGIANYGMAIANSMRRDLATKFANFAGEVGKFAEDGTNLLIDYGWLESPPQAPHRTN